MNSKVHPLVVLLVIVHVFVVIGVWTWGSGQAKQHGGPAQLVSDPSGHLYVQMQNVLLEHDADGRFLQRHDLSRIGVERVLGAVGFFSNGDLLLRRGPDSRTVLDNIRAYFRLSNEKSPRPELPEVGIYRCELRSASCVPFGSELIDFTASFGLYIDPRTDEVYVSDTTRHTLRKYSDKGESLGEAVDGFRFPNQLLIHDGRLYVADTNHHRVRIVDPGSGSFGEEIASADVTPKSGESGGQVWPSHLARVGSEWWVNNMRANMADGGIYIFDDNWNIRRKVNLPAGADPIAMTIFGDEVLISDWNNDRVYRVTTKGRLLGEFESSGLQELVTESIARRWHYKTYAYLGVITLSVVLLALLIKGLATSLSEPLRMQRSRKEAPAAFPDKLIWVKPDAKVVRKITLSGRTAGVVVFGLVLLVAFLGISVDDRVVPPLLAPLIIGAALIFLLLLRVNYTNVNTAIGLCGNKITLRDHAGNDTVLPIKDVIFNKTVIAGSNAAVFLGQPQMPIYDPEVLRTQVFPRLACARSVSTWEMQKSLFRMRHTQGFLALLLVIGILTGGLWLLMLKMVS